MTGTPLGSTSWGTLMPKESRADRAEMQKRIDEILRIRLDGAQFHDVMHFVAEKGWKLSERQVRNYMRKADELLVERREPSRKRLVARHIAMREALYARAVNGADLRTALAVADSLAKMQNLFSSEREMSDLIRA